MRRKTTGVRKRHSRRCGSHLDRRCDCKPTWEASSWSRRERRRVWRTFPTEAAAKAWRRDAEAALEKGTMKATSTVTLRETAEAWLEGVEDDSIRNRSGDPYKPSVLRGYKRALKQRILPDLGGVRLSDVRRNDVQDLADRMIAEGCDPSTVRNALMPLRAVYRRAIARGQVAVNPTTNLELPAVRGRRDRIADPQEAAKLIAAVPVRGRALWATAMYAGLRAGELLALRWSDVDLAEGVIRVERSWDVKAGPVEPKSKAGRRAVPIAAALRDCLVEHKLAQRRSEGLVFGRTAERPFNPSSVVRRAKTAWQSAGLNPIKPQEARHTFASLMIAAGVNAKALSTYLGHANISITFDRYGHLMPGNEAEAADLLDAYLASASARAAEVRSDSSPPHVKHDEAMNHATEEAARPRPLSEEGEYPAEAPVK